jgi:glycosyltransferase involved in cell wall biosynthesis
MSERLRVLFLDEGVLGHRTLTAQLKATLAGNAAVETTFATVPPPNRLERLLLRRWKRAGDADMFALRWRLRWSWQVRRLLKRHRRSVDAAFISTQASALLIRGPMRRLPCVLSIDATVGQFTALEYGGPGDAWTPRQQRFLKRLERRALRGAAAVVAWTGWNEEALRREYDTSEMRLATIHPGLDGAWWGQAAAARPVRRKGPLRVLFVGNEVERKGLGTLVDAVGRLEGEAILDVVSTDPVPESAQVRPHRDVKARTEQLRDLYAAADVLALPTRADAVPWVVLEAMAAGLPVVASDVGAIGELLGDSGELVRPDDPEQLAAALRRLADPERRRRLGARALERVRESYDSPVQVQRLLEFLEEVAGRPASMQGRGRMRRRTFVAVGAGVAAVAVVAPYAALIPDDEFEKLVASNLGIDPKLAGQLLARARSEYGDTEYDARATAFALAVRDPAAIVLPDSAREKAISGLLDPMLAAPAASLAYAITGTDPGSPGACAGLVRES